MAQHLAFGVVGGFSYSVACHPIGKETHSEIGAIVLVFGGKNSPNMDDSKRFKSRSLMRTDGCAQTKVTCRIVCCDGFSASRYWL